MTRVGIASVLAVSTLLAACGGGKQQADTTTLPPPVDETNEEGPVGGPAPAAPLPNPPEGYHTVSTSLVVPDVDAAVDYYAKAFNATKNFTMPGPDGKKSMHAEIKIGDSILMVGAEMPEMGAKSPRTLGGTPVSLVYYVPDTDAVVQAATAAGGKVLMQPADMFWGDRWAVVEDPAGHRWAIATHKEVLTEAQVNERMQAMMAAMGAPKDDKAKKGKKGKKSKKDKKAQEAQAQAPQWAPGEPAKSHVREGYHSVTPMLVVDNAKALLDFYQQGLGAEVRGVSSVPDGRIIHAEIKIGDSILTLADKFPEMEGDSKSPKDLGGSPVGFYVYVPDTDAAFQKAVSAGAEARQQPQDAFWGDRYAELKDPSGHSWSLATPKEKLTPEQINERMKAQFAGANK
jgi:PhnB protein